MVSWIIAVAPTLEPAEVEDRLIVSLAMEILVPLKEVWVIATSPAVIEPAFRATVSAARLILVPALRLAWVILTLPTLRLAAVTLM